MLEVYQQSPFAMLEKLLSSTAYGDSLMVFVFHLSHLLLRKLLYPDKTESIIVFRKLFCYQTSQLLSVAGHLMPFKDWLCYIDAVEQSAEQRAICLLSLIQQELDFKNADDYWLAEAAIKDLLKDDEMDESAMVENQDDEDLMEDDERRLTWLESPHSRSYLLLKLQKAFVTRQFAQMG